MRQSDDELIKRCQNGDVSAFDEVVKRYRTPLVNFVARFINDRDTAEDLAQETFLRVYKTIGRYKFNVAQFSTWLYRIASNLCKNEVRNRKRRWRHFINPIKNADETSNSELDDLIASAPAGANYMPDYQVESKELKKLIQMAIAQLPPKYRTPFVLRDINQLSYEEIAKVLRLPTGTVKSRINRARFMMKDKLKDLKDYV